MNFVFTGHAVINNVHYPRNQLEQLARDQGHYVDNKVTYNTTCLVTNGTKKGTIKYRNAVRYNVKIITPEQFLDMMMGLV
jgi:NAD-dependent DNA ligase